MNSLIVSLAALFFTWAVLRISRNAVGPLLADSRVAATSPIYGPRNDTVQSHVTPAGAMLRAVVMAGVAAAIAFAVYASNIANAATTISFDIRYGFAYAYNPFAAVSVPASIAIGFLVFARIGVLKSLAVFIALMAVTLIADFVFNVVGSFGFEDRRDFFVRGVNGYHLWIVSGLLRYLGYLAVASLASAQFRHAGRWIVVIVAGMVWPAILASGSLSFLYQDRSLVWLVYVLPSVLVPAVIGWWQKPVEGRG